MQVYDDLDAHIQECQYDIRSVGYDPYNAREFTNGGPRTAGGVGKVIQGAKQNPSHPAS